VAVFRVTGTRSASPFEPDFEDMTVGLCPRIHHDPAMVSWSVVVVCVEYGEYSRENAGARGVALSMGVVLS